MTKKHFSLEYVLISLFMIMGVFIEHAFGLYGVLVILLLLLFQRKSIVFFLILNIIVGCISDLLFHTPLGVTTLVLHAVLFAWISLANVSRMRFVFYVLIVVMATVILCILRTVHIPVLTLIILTILSWILVRQLYAPQYTKERFSI